MQRTTLKDYAKEVGQQAVANQLGTSQYAISKAVNSDRKIFIIQKDNNIKAVEERDFPAKNHKKVKENE